MPEHSHGATTGLLADDGSKQMRQSARWEAAWRASMALVGQDGAEEEAETWLFVLCLWASPMSS